MRGWWLILFLLTATAAHAGELKFATWNLNWLTFRDAGLPENVKLREAEDWETLRGYAIALDADIVAIQEVDGPDAAARVFPPDRYVLHMTGDRVIQRVGFAVRRGIAFDINPDVRAIALEPGSRLRSGADITLRLPSGPLRVLTVHLKSGCQRASVTTRAPQRVCLTLISQFDVVDQWIAERRDEGVPFVLLGDFNRAMEKREKLIAKAQAVAPMIRVTEGLSSPCWNLRDSFIDHILVGGPARAWIVPNSVRVMTYRETDPVFKERLSDHCPVSVRLAGPG